MFCTGNSSVSLGQESNTTFVDNIATNGGGIYSENYCRVVFEDNITLTSFISNSASTGGAIYCANESFVSISTNSEARFTHNMATIADNLFSEKNCAVRFIGKH